MLIHELLAEASTATFSSSEVSKLKTALAAIGVKVESLDQYGGKLRFRADFEGKKPPAALKRTISSTLDGANVRYEENVGPGGYQWVVVLKAGTVAPKKMQPMTCFSKVVRPQIAEKLGVAVNELQNVWPEDLGGSDKQHDIWEFIEDVKYKTLSKFSVDGFDGEGEYTWEVAIVEYKGTKFASLFLQEGGPGADGTYVIKKSDVSKFKN